ncbi:MAG: hypothetical protein ACXADO_09105 [Candidatus Thorarchaeota archaeon]
MSGDFEEKFIKPIVHASYPGTLAALNLTVLQVTPVDAPLIIRMIFALGSMTFLLSAFTIFFYTIYPTKKRLWSITALAFLLGLFCSVIAIIFIMI